MLDAFADHGELLEEYRSAFLEMDDIRRRIRSLHMDEAEKARRIENLNFQIQEITLAAAPPDDRQPVAGTRARTPRSPHRCRRHCHARAS